MSEPRAFSIEDERRVFDQALPGLLREHEGQFAVFHHGEPVAFFPTANEAYELALERFGIDEVFLIAQVVPPTTTPISIAWSAGVMFG